jgi:ribonuclease HII
MLLSRYNDIELECGLDESGAGTAFGPVVASAVIMPTDWFHPLLNDSKKVNEKNRIILFEEIKKFAIEWSISEVSAQEIDDINILQARFEAMNKAVMQLARKPEHLIVDGNKFNNKTGIIHTCIVKGDAKYTSIAAASILAKVYRDELMTKMNAAYSNWNIAKHKGYLTKEHIKLISEYGISDQHRKTFLKNYI